MAASQGIVIAGVIIPILKMLQEFRMSRYEFNRPHAGLALIVFVLLSGCGSSDVSLDTGPDFSDSPLRVSVATPPRQILLFWEEVENATHYRIFEDANGESDGELQFIQLGGDIPAGTLQYLRDVSVHLYDWANARFMLQACVDGLCEELGQQSVRGLSFASVGRFLPAASGIDPGFGFSIGLAEEGHTLAVGAARTSLFDCEVIVPVEVIPGETVLEECQYNQDLTPEQVDALNLTQLALNAGAVNVLVFDDGEWNQQAFIMAPNMDAGDFFGASVAISDDGNTLAVGAPLEDSAASGVDGDLDDNEAAGSGAVYVYSRVLQDDEHVWLLQAYIKASNTDQGDQFGTAVALSGDGQTLAVAAPLESSNATGVDGDQANNDAASAGAVYVFMSNMGDWTQQAYIKADNAGAGDLFGGVFAAGSLDTLVASEGLTLNQDGSRLAVGAVGESSGAAGINGDGFNDGASLSGAVYVFDRSGLSWAQSVYLKAQAPGASDRFGWSLALDGSGDRLVVGAPREDSRATGVNGNAFDNSATNSGAAYLFEFDGAEWSQTDYFKASNSDDLDEFGYSVSINKSGDMLLASAWREGGRSSGINGTQALDDLLESGAAYLFQSGDSAWVQTAYIKAGQNLFNLQFGWDTDFALDGQLLGVSAQGQSRVVFIY